MGGVHQLLRELRPRAERRAPTSWTNKIACAVAGPPQVTRLLRSGPVTQRSLDRNPFSATFVLYCVFIQSPDLSILRKYEISAGECKDTIGFSAYSAYPIYHPRLQNCMAQVPCSLTLELSEL